MSANPEFEFRDPPPRNPTGRPRPAWRVFGEAHPGQWFVAQTAPRADGFQRYEGWEFTSRKREDGLVDTFARFTPRGKP